MTQEEAIANLDRIEEYIKINWPKWGHSMQFVAMQSRRGLIKQLQRIQLQEFEK